MAGYSSLPRYGYTPSLLPDELLYSLLGRFIKFNALGDPRSALQILFGSRTIIPCIDLPTHITELHSQIGPIPPCDSALELIQLGTLFPYHRPFLTDVQCKKALHILNNGGGIGLKTLIGRVANRFGANVVLRYCPLCAADDLAAYGSNYWHRSHNLPGVKSCHLHEVDLVVYERDDANRYRQQIVLMPYPVANLEASVSNPRQVRFAKLSRELLFSALPAIEPSHRTQVYENALRRLGITKGTVRVDLNGLISELRRFHCDFDGFLHQDRILSSSLEPVRWVKEIFRRPSTAIHPICHLLLIDFLFEDVATFANALISCRERQLITSPESHAIKITNPTVDPNKNLELLADVSNSCRSIARQLKTSVNSVVLARRRMGIAISERSKIVTSDRRRHVQEMLSNGASPEYISVNENLSLSTVYRLLSESQLVSAAHKKIRDEQELKKRRGRWTAMCEKHQTEGITTIRNLDGSTYYWLYRNDRLWLQASCRRIPKKLIPRTSRLDWNKRDVTLRDKLIDYVTELTAREDHPRISKSLMLRCVGDAMARKNAKRLPRLWVEIHKREEPIISYQIRRIDRVMETLPEGQQLCSLSMLLRKVGIGKPSPPLRRYLKKILK